MGIADKEAGRREKREQEDLGGVLGRGGTVTSSQKRAIGLLFEQKRDPEVKTRSTARDFLKTQSWARCAGV